MTIVRRARRWLGRAIRRSRSVTSRHAAQPVENAAQGLATNSGWCPCCRSDTEFIETGVWLRDQYLCRRCKSIPRMRAINRTLDAYFPGWEALLIHESSPSNDFVRRFRLTTRGRSFSKVWSPELSMQGAAARTSRR